MSKKLLSEAQLRRFAKLASLNPINEEWGGRPGDKHNAPGGSKRGSKPGDEDYINEDAFEDEAELGADAAEGELDDAEMGSLDAEAGLEDEPPGEEIEMGGDMDLGAREEIAMDVISAVADALNIEVDIEGGEEVVDDFEAEDDIPLPDEEEVVDDVEIEDEEEAIMEALRGINYIPGKKAIVNEVAKRVAKRLLEAKKAEQRLQEALGNTPRRRKTATSSARRKIRPTRSTQRRTKK